MKNFKEERTFLMVKPDGVRKELIGEIIKRLEQRDLKIVAIEMFTATPDQVHNHYPKDDAWVSRLGDKTLSTYHKYNIDAKKELGTDDNSEIGKMVRSWLIDPRPCSRRCGQAARDKAGARSNPPPRSWARA
jgi:nucleoside-diphosphate kinase